MESETHITPSRLLETIRGDSLRNYERDHVAACADCKFTLSWLTTIEEMRGLAAAPDPPAELVAAAIGVASPPRRPFLKQLEAILAFDTFAAPQPAGIRPGHSEVRHLVYNGGLLEITFQVNTTKSSSMTIAGQLATTPDGGIVPNAIIHLVDENNRLETSSDDGGQFLFEDIPMNTYSIEVQCNDVGVTIGRFPPPYRHDGQAPV